ncbi:MAG TPA: glycosyltransferase family 2 protein [Terriglobia bacterium]
MEISAVIVTLNEERNLGRALESLQPVADEVLVVDSGSTDRTRQIAESRGARFLEHPWEGYSRQKNYAASQARHDWVLSLDADEALGPELATEIQQIRQAGPGDAAGFRMPRLARYQGHWILHSGWYPDRKLRLYDRRRGCWVGDYVHERIEVDGPVRELRGNLLHYTCDSMEEHLRSVDRYTTLAAEDSFARQEGWILLRMLALPPWKFIETYLLRQGFRDGAAGLRIAAMAGYYVWRKYAKLRGMIRSAKSAHEAVGR